MSKAYFISDMHLGARYIADSRAHERRVCEFLGTISADASELYILGDALDYWFEYRTAVPRGHVRFFGALARLADAGVKITWLTGNHDIWLFDYLRDEIGIEVVDAPMLPREILGSKFVLAHGDRIGPQTASFRFICKMFRNRVCQRLYAAIHPGLTVPFAQGWSRHSREHGEYISARQFTERFAQICSTSAQEVLATYPDTRHIVLGHHHYPYHGKVDGADCDMTVLGNWTENAGSYAVFDGKTLRLETF